MTDLVRLEVDSPTITFDDSLGKAQPLNPPHVAILLEYLSARFPCGTCTFQHLPETVLGFKTAPEHQEKPESEQSRIRPPLPPGARERPGPDGPSRVHQGVQTLHKRTLFILTLFSNPASELGSETAPPFRGLGERLCTEHLSILDAL